MSQDREIIVGIDLGTTNSLVAYHGPAGPEVITDETGERYVPSVLSFSDDKQITLGQHAKSHAVENPLRTVYSIKRLMGRGYQELKESGELDQLPYPVRRRRADQQDRDIAAVEIEGELLTPPEISALILRELKRRAEAKLGQPIRKAVITVPAYFDDAQRQATRDAGRIAGLEVARILNEPTAAALAYGLGIREQTEKVEAANRELSLAGSCPTQDDADETTDASQAPSTDQDDSALIAVYDLGGGTFDISILRLEAGIFEVQSTNGNSCLGGDDLDREIIQLVEREVKQQYGIEIDSPSIRQALRTFAENVKIKLSQEDEAAIEIQIGPDRTYRRTITRDEFETMIDPWINKTLDSCKRALADAHVEPEEIDQVILVGGSTRIPRVRERIEALFNREPYTALDPDEVVAIGGAVQASILSGTTRDALLLDVIPLSLGIETMGGAMGKLILRNTRIPCKATEQFSTFVDGQTNVKLNVLQGERELAKDCRSLAEFELRGIPPMPAGLPRIEVTFLIDENGILNVSAIEKRSNTKASIQIVPTHGLTGDEISRMENESYQFAREDMSAHRLIDLRNQIAFDTHKTEQMLNNVGDQLDPKELEEISGRMAALRRLADTSDDPEALHKALTEFDRRTVHLAEVAITNTLSHDDKSD